MQTRFDFSAIVPEADKEQKRKDIADIMAASDAGKIGTEQAFYFVNRIYAGAAYTYEMTEFLTEIRTVLPTKSKDRPGWVALIPITSAIESTTGKRIKAAEIAKICDVKINTVYIWQHIGALPPGRAEKLTRYLTHKNHLQEVKKLKKSGML